MVVVIIFSGTRTTVAPALVEIEGRARIVSDVRLPVTADTVQLRYASSWLDSLALRSS
jgi:hypothetical protein